MCHRSGRAWKRVVSGDLGLVYIVRLEGDVPETMNCPAVGRSSGGVGVPELGLQKVAARVIEAACVLGGRVATA